MCIFASKICYNTNNILYYINKVYTNNIKNWIKTYTSYNSPSWVTTCTTKLNYLITF